MRSGNPVLGAEQIFDIELDRNAQPLPADTSVDHVPNSMLWSEDRGVSDRIIEGEPDKFHSAMQDPETEVGIKSEPESDISLPTEGSTNEEEAEPCMRSPFKQTYSVN
jgi:hypothetical protein